MYLESWGDMRSKVQILHGLRNSETIQSNSIIFNRTLPGKQDQMMFRLI